MDLLLTSGGLKSVPEEVDDKHVSNSGIRKSRK